MKATKNSITDGKSGVSTALPSNSGISRDDWLRALADAGFDDSTDDQSAVTIAEFGQLMGYPNEWASKRRLEALVAAGKASETKKWSLDARGRRVQCRAFRLAGGA